MPASLLASLLTSSQADLAERISSQLPLAALGSLLCTSRATRDWLQAQPEALWEVSDSWLASPQAELLTKLRHCHAGSR